MTIKSDRKRRQAGTALVETALSLTLYTYIVFSLVDFGYVMYMFQTLSQRAENAARYGALNPTDSTGMQNYVLYNAATGSGSGIFGLTSSNVTATRSGSGTTADRVTVKVTNFHYPMISPGMSGTGKDIIVTIPVENN
jgi:Flp pilus assembly protein TadG